MFDLKNILFILCAFSWNTAPEASLNKWPTRFPRCYRDDPNLNKCILEATKTMKPFLKEGIPEFNISSISPFFVPEVTIEQGNSDDAINYKVVLKNLQIFGFDSYKFDKFDFDVKNLQFQSSLKMDSLYLSGDYLASGKILSIPVNGNGKMSCNVSGSTGTLKQDAKIVRKKNVEFLELDPPVIHISVGNIIGYHYEGLFDGNEVLAKAADRVFQDHQEELTEEVKPVVEKIIEEIVYDLQKKYTYKIPYDELYPTHR